MMVRNADRRDLGQCAALPVRGGRVTIKPSMFYFSKEGEMPYTVFRVDMCLNFPDDIDETIEIIKKQLLEAQCKINLDINPEGLRE